MFSHLKFAHTPLDMYCINLLILKTVKQSLVFSCLRQLIMIIYFKADFTGTMATVGYDDDDL